jgi:sugar phosphate isomerase/epimerase
MAISEVPAARPRLSLDSLTLTDTDPRDLIRSAHKAGFDLVSLWLHPPSVYPKQLVAPWNVDECQDLLAQTGVRVHSVEAIDLVSTEAVLAARSTIELGARLGAKVLVAMNHVNADRDQVIEAFRVLVDLAADHGLGVNLEPLAMGKTRTLAEARDLIHDAAVDAGIVFDTYHFARNGEPLEALRAIDPTLLRYVQISDAPASVSRRLWGAESCQDRRHPGEGDFALIDMLRLLPQNVPWAVEIPRLSWTKVSVPAKAQASVAMEGLRDLLGRLQCGPASELH